MNFVEWLIYFHVTVVSRVVYTTLPWRLVVK